jgi:hypothetical protein
MGTRRSPTFRKCSSRELMSRPWYLVSPVSLFQLLDQRVLALLPARQFAATLSEAATVALQGCCVQHGGLRSRARALIGSPRKLHPTPQGRRGKLQQCLRQRESLSELIHAGWWQRQGAEAEGSGR